MFFWILLATFWLFIYILHRKHPAAFTNRGITVGIAQIGCQFESIPRWIHTFCDRWRKPIIRVWFDFGILVGLTLLPISIYTLFYNLILAFYGKEEPQIITLMVPGVNISFSQLGHVLLALGVNGIIHEIGHTMAATIEGVVPKSFGVFVYFMYPGAYVDLGPNVMDLSPRARMRVYTAGAWHNVVLALIAFGLLVSIPVILSPIFTSSQGLVVAGISSGSPLKGPGGLVVGDILSGIDGCHVSGISDWYQCLEKQLHNINSGEHREGGAGRVGFKGHCLGPENMRKNAVNWGQADCCVNETQFHDLKCLKRSNGVMYKKDLGCSSLEELGPPMCSNDDDCVSDEICYHRVIPPSTTSTLMVLSRRVGAPILYYGPPLVLADSITTSNYWPKYMSPDGHGTITASIVVQIPTILETWLRFLVSVSAAVAMLNILPIPLMDGDWIIRNIVDSFVNCSHAVKVKIVHGVLALGSALLGLNVIVWLVSLI